MLKRGIEPIGAGSYKRVYPEAQNPEKKVVAEFRVQMPPEQIKSLYYLGKISHILFPDNIPNVYFAGNSHKTSNFRADREELDEDHQLGNIIFLEDEDYFIRKSESPKLKKTDVEYIYDITDKRNNNQVVRDFVDKAFSSGLYIDSGGQNFSFDANGQVKYLDLNPAWEYRKNLETDVLNFDPDLLLVTINKISDSVKKDKALIYFKRLMQLIPKNLCP